RNLGELLLQRCDLVAHIELLIAGQPLQFVDLLFQLDDGFLELECRRCAHISSRARGERARHRATPAGRPTLPAWPRASTIATADGHASLLPHSRYQPSSAPGRASSRSLLLVLRSTAAPLPARQATRRAIRSPRAPHASHPASTRHRR